MIFYFSATGNSKYVAQRIADETGDTLISVTDCIRTNCFDFSIREGEQLGFATPVYHLGLPTIVVDFMEKLSLMVKGRPYVYHVLTFYTSTGKAHKMMEQSLRTRGLALNGKFTVQMPDTWTPSFDLSDKKRVEKILAEGEKQTNAAVSRIQSEVVGDYNKHKLPFSQLYYQHYRHGGKTDKFTVDATCIGCGICENRCPDFAIQVQGKKPVWIKSRCVQCLGCLHHCPVFAIQYGKNTRKHGQYVNPYVSL